MAASKRIHQMTFAQWEKAFPDEDSCKAYLAHHRWAEGVYCPRCGATGPYELKARPFHWQCKECSTHGYRFSILVGTIFENTNKPLRDWFRVIHLMLTSKMGISSHQIYRSMGFGSYETALFMTHRIRAALIDQNFRKLIGIVEVDETFVGGKIQNKHIGKRGWDKHGGGALGKGSNKAIVAGAVERGGKVFARVLQNVSAATLNSFVREVTSDKVSLVCTDAFKAYSHLGMHRPHASVDHASGEYVHHDDELADVIHTQTIEVFAA